MKTKSSTNKISVFPSETTSFENGNPNTTDGFRVGKTILSQDINKVLHGISLISVAFTDSINVSVNYDDSLSDAKTTIINALKKRNVISATKCENANAFYEMGDIYHFTYIYNYGLAECGDYNTQYLFVDDIDFIYNSSKTIAYANGDFSFAREGKIESKSIYFYSLNLSKSKIGLYYDSDENQTLVEIEDNNNTFYFPNSNSKTQLTLSNIHLYLQLCNGLSSTKAFIKNNINRVMKVSVNHNSVWKDCFLIYNITNSIPSSVARILMTSEDGFENTYDSQNLTYRILYISYEE